MTVPSNRRWYQFSLRTLLLGVTLAAVPLALVGRSLSLARQATFHRSQFPDIRMRINSNTEAVYGWEPGTEEYYHLKAAEAYERAAWRPWFRVVLPDPPLSRRLSE